MNTDRPVSNTIEHDAPAALLDLSSDDLIAAMRGLGEPSYRAEQVLQWVYRRGVTSFDEMTNLPPRLRATLTQRWTVYRSTIALARESTDGTTKLLLEWPDRATSECVLIPEAKRSTACISTQVGCPAGCVFCASGIGGLQRDLTSAEMIEQAMRIRDLCRGRSRLSNVVFMGLGEPLANYASTVRALKRINAPDGMDIGARKITVSTVGLPSKMRALADERMQVTLALSLHAPNDDLRRRIIPWAKRVAIGELVDACVYYFQQTGREVTLEYILLGGLNDTDDHARELAAVSRRMRSNVNLLKYNPVAGLPFSRPDDAQVERFLGVLCQKGVNAHVRVSRGLDVAAACGQLRREAALPSGPRPSGSGGTTPASGAS